MSTNVYTQHYYSKTQWRATRETDKLLHSGRSITVKSSETSWDQFCKARSTITQFSYNVACATLADTRKKILRVVNFTSRVFPVSVPGGIARTRFHWNLKVCDEFRPRSVLPMSEIFYLMKKKHFHNCKKYKIINKFFHRQYSRTGILESSRLPGSRNIFLFYACCSRQLKKMLKCWMWRRIYCVKVTLEDCLIAIANQIYNHSSIAHS